MDLNPSLAYGLLMGDPSLTGLLGDGQIPGPQLTPGADPQMPPPTAAPMPQVGAPMQMTSTADAPPNAGAVPQLPMPGAPGTVPGASPQMNVPPAVAAPMPALPQLGQKQSLLGRVHDALMAPFMTSNDESSYKALLTPDEIASTREGMFARLKHTGYASAGAEQQAKLDHLVSMKLGVQGIMQQQHVQQVRQNLFNEIGMPDNGDPESDPNWVKKALPYLMANGDVEGTKILSPIYQKLVAPDKPFEPQLFEDPQGNQHYLTPDAHTTIQPGWHHVQTSGGSGVPQLFKNAAGQPVWIQPGQPIPPGFTLNKDAMTYYTEGQTNNRADRTHVTDAVKDFRKAVDPYAKKAQAINQARSIFALYDGATPQMKTTLYGPTISNFVQAAEQPNNLRFQLLQYYSSHLDPSLQGHWNLLKARLLQGTLPGYTLKDMQAVVDGMAQTTRGEIDAQRGDALLVDPGLDKILPPTDSFFINPSGAPTSAPPATGGNYSPNNPFAKR